MPETSLEAPPQSLSARLLLLLATGTGLTVASLYYSQPLLGLLGADLRVDNRTVGWVPTLTQLGYALGLLLLAPLGDRYDRRRIILFKAGLLCAALLLTSAAPSMGLLLVASLAVGITATLAQDLVPAAATLAPAAQRGKAVGTVMTGLLLGVLLSRTASGVIAEHFGWRTMFVVAAASIALLAGALWRGLPRFTPTSQLAYGALLGSLVTLWRRHGELRRAALAQGLLALAFSAFWSTLAVVLHGAPFHLGAAATGAFGLVGAAGALAASIVGRLADRRGPEPVIRLGAGLAAVSFASLALLPWLSSGAGLVLIGVSALGFDLGVQATLISHQTLVYGIDPPARSRLNAVLMVVTFIGMASGAALGSQALALWGSGGVTAVSTTASTLALGVRLWGSRAR